MIGGDWFRALTLDHYTLFIGSGVIACEITIVGNVCRDAAIPNAAGSVLVPCAVGRGNRVVRSQRVLGTAAFFSLTGSGCCVCNFLWL